MPIVIEDFEAEITPADEAAEPGPRQEGAAAPDAQMRAAWLALRDLQAEREARLALD
jgi:hypothetical protein